MLKQEGIDVKIIKEANETRVYFKDTESNIIEFYTKSMTRRLHKTSDKEIVEH
ncbi:hypothetical protein OC195_11970 [Priestia flexa]|nr:hypothetical protein OC195_11970 [Priestia flexa]